MTHTVAVLAIVAYIVATALMVVQMWRPSVGGKTRRSGLLAFGLGFLFHSITLIAILADPRMMFLDNGADYFFWVSWGIALVFAVSWKKLSYPIFGAFLIPAVVLFMASSSYLLHKESPSLLTTPSVGTTEEFMLSILHGVPALVSVISLALAFVVSAVFIIVERRLKKRTAQALNMSGPNLQLLDALNRQLVQIGFVAISLVVLSGGLWAVSEQKPVFSLDTSVVSGIVMWVLLAFILHVRLILKWSPRKVSTITIFATGLFFVSVFAVMAVSGRLTHASIFS
jgi:ABC-type uncharacterized transport system permease subunit